MSLLSECGERDEITLEPNDVVQSVRTDRRYRVRLVREGGDLLAECLLTGVCTDMSPSQVRLVGQCEEEEEK